MYLLRAILDDILLRAILDDILHLLGGQSSSPAPIHAKLGNELRKVAKTLSGTYIILYIY
jgi:hypothetical protein